MKTAEERDQTSIKNATSRGAKRQCSKDVSIFWCEPFDLLTMITSL